MDEKKLLETFGFNLKIERMRSRLSQEQLAEIVDVSKTYISNVETAKHDISITNAYKLSRAVNKTIEDLLQENS